MSITNLLKLKEALQGKELELLEKLLQDADLLHEAFDNVDQLGHGKLEIDKRTQRRLASQIFEYFCCLHRSEMFRCLSPRQTSDIFGEIYFHTKRSESAITCPDGLSWLDGNQTLWFNEYETNHRNFAPQKKADKYAALFRFLSPGSEGSPRYILVERLRERGYNGSPDAFGVYMVIPGDDKYNFQGKFMHPFQIDNCPVTMRTVEAVSRAFVADYPSYFGIQTA